MKKQKQTISNHLVADIPVLDLDKNPDEIYSGRWINADYLESWLKDAIDSINTAQKIRTVEWREAMKSTYKSILTRLK